jgi:hypothetical protein
VSGTVVAFLAISYFLGLIAAVLWAVIALGSVALFVVVPLVLLGPLAGLLLLLRATRPAYIGRPRDIWNDGTFDRELSERDA